MNVTIAGIQMRMCDDIQKNILTATNWVRKAAQKGAQVILLPELFSGKYFCQIENYDHFKLAIDPDHSEMLEHFSQLAEELKVVLPISFFEKSGNVFYNSIVVFDADGKNLGMYRKTHIPTGECYEEKFYFTPGDTGFKVFDTQYGKLGIGICWDQWFCETARSLALLGAEILLFPTAIGSEPVLPKDSKDHWQNTMCGHAACNIIPLLAANRVGTEVYGDSKMTFYGSSFIANEEGTKVEELSKEEEGILLHTFDLATIAEKRYSWGVFRDRRPEMYSVLLTKDGKMR